MRNKDSILIEQAYQNMKEADQSNVAFPGKISDIKWFRVGDATREAKPMYGDYTITTILATGSLDENNKVFAWFSTNTKDITYVSVINAQTGERVDFDSDKEEHKSIISQVEQSALNPENWTRKGLYNFLVTTLKNPTEPGNWRSQD
ncbi:MAG: hypothetical protein EBU90_29985 [Proteobacteria bacterium]|nr:hypothetical protein [Pseudomonadota bacterium]